MRSYFCLDLYELCWMSEKFTNGALFGWQEIGGKERYSKELKL